MHRLCSISVDLDPLRCYYEIHGLGAPPPSLREVILRRALPRFGEVLARRGIRGTFFVVGQDLDEDAAGRANLRALARAGHELANHSDSHPYDLGRRDAAEVEREITRAHERIARVAGQAPVGFRAPGYDVSAAIFDVLGRLGYRYDSSLFPAPLYWAAKAAVMGALAIARRPSGAVLGDPRALAAPLVPYRPDPRRPWRRGRASFVELPIAVTPIARLWVIGTTVLTAPSPLRAHLLGAMRGRRFFNFELHGIDLVDAEGDGIPAELVARQPDLRVPLAEKRKALEATLDRITEDFAFAPLRDAAAEVHRGDLG